MEFVLTYLKVFLVGGAFCAVAQALVVRTKITPARILVIFLLLGVLLESIGVFKYILDFAQAGASVPIVGFGASLAKHAIKMAKEEGILGAFKGAFTGTAVGLSATIVFSYIAALITSSKTKRR